MLNPSSGSLSGSKCMDRSGELGCRGKSGSAARRLAGMEGVDGRLDRLSAGRDCDAAARRLKREGASERLSFLEPDREDGGFSMLEDNKCRDSELLEAPFTSTPNLEGGGFGGSEFGFAGMVPLLGPSRLR